MPIIPSAFACLLLAVGTSAPDPQVPPAPPPQAPATGGDDVPAAPTREPATIDRPGEPPAMEESERRERARRDALEQLRRECLPEPITEEDLRAFADEVGASEESKALLPRIADNYRRAWADLDARTASEIRGRLEASYRFDERSERVVSVPTPELLELLAARSRLVDAIVEADAAVFRELEAIGDPLRRTLLADIRHERLQRVFRRREVLPGATLDLIDLLADLEIDASARMGMLETIERYRRDHQRLVEARFREGLAIDAEEATLRVNLLPAWELIAAPAERAEVEAQLRDLARRGAELDAPLRALLRETLVAWRRMLPDEEGRRLQEAYQRRTYPELFRDEVRLAALVERVSKAAAFDEAKLAAVGLSLDRCSRELQRPGLLLMELADSLVAVEALPDPADRAEAAMLLESRVLEIQERRRDRIDAAVREVATLVPGERVEATAAIAEFGSTDESLRRAASFRRAMLGRSIAALRELARNPRPIEEPEQSPEGDEDPAAP